MANSGMKDADVFFSTASNSSQGISALEVPDPLTAKIAGGPPHSL